VCFATVSVKYGVFMDNSIYGALNINKSPGVTSHDVVERVRKLLRQRKVGHTGTLDPAASGVLPICVGKATRLSQYLLEADKEYLLIAKLGETTDTQDASGKILETKNWQGVTREDIQRAIQQFIGEIEQTPPMYSACKHNGQRLYKLAREGQWVRRQPRRVIIHRLQLKSVDLPMLNMEVSCSKGTYMRTLCADLGDVLGCGAHLHKLQRTRCGQFLIDQAISLDELRFIIKQGRLQEKIYPIEQMLAHLPAVTIARNFVRQVALGAPIMVGGILNIQGTITKGIKLRLYNQTGKLLAIAESCIDFNGETPPKDYEMAFKPKRVLV
jgi:tRNA pseudouridine55 synthase